MHEIKVLSETAKVGWLDLKMNSLEKGFPLLMSWSPATNRYFIGTLLVLRTRVITDALPNGLIQAILKKTQSDNSHLNTKANQQWFPQQ